MKSPHRAAHHHGEDTLFCLLHTFHRRQQLINPHGNLIAIGDGQGVFAVGAPRHQGIFVCLRQAGQVDQRVIDKLHQMTVEFLHDKQMGRLLNVLGRHAVVHVLAAFCITSLHQHLNDRHKPVTNLTHQPIDLRQIDPFQLAVGGDIFCRSSRDHTDLGLRHRQSAFHI
ncbi:hypothetical protein D3C78_1407640 [compost metagenome]